MRSLNNLQIVVPKDKLIIGEFYMLYTICPIVNTLIEWRFRFSGFNDDTGGYKLIIVFVLKGIMVMGIIEYVLLIGVVTVLYYVTIRKFLVVK